jgi:hypothetical protein
MKKYLLFLCLLIALSNTSLGQAQYPVDIASSSPTTASPGVVFGWPAYASQNFLYDGEYINLYGFGFHGYNDGTSIGGVNAYVSSYFGIDFFTAGQRRFRINANGSTFFDQNLWVNNGATISSDFSDSDPNLTWNSNLSVRNNNNAINTFSRLTFVSQSGGMGAISLRKTDAYSGDMYFQVRNGPGFYITPMLIKANGNVGIGTTDPGSFKLAVNGKIWGTEVQVAVTRPPDYVFEPTYQLKPLAEIETYIKENKHLPEVPSAKEMEKNGVQLGEMNMLLLKKIEEVALFLIEQNKEMRKLKSENENMKQVISDLSDLKSQFESIKSKLK